MAHITDRLSNAKWGVFNHYISGVQNNPEHPNNQGAGRTSWDECVHALDTEKLARGLHDCGAQAFTLAPLGIAPEGREWDAWGRHGVKHDSAYLRNYISCCNSVGGTVTIDIALNRDGSLDREQVETLAEIGI